MLGRAVGDEMGRLDIESDPWKWEEMGFTCGIFHYMEVTKMTYHFDF